MREIQLSNGQLTKVSDEDYWSLMMISTIWHVDHWGYVVFWTSKGRKNKITYYMHREVAKRIGLNLLKKTDHEDEIKINNQRNNLREADNSQNQTNSGAHKDNQSGLKNIHYNEKINKWVIDIRKRDKRFQKECDTKEEAIKIRNKMLIQLHGDFAHFD